MSNAITTELILKAQQGDAQAHQKIIELFARPIRATVARFVRKKRPYDLEDHVQDIFLKVFSRIGSFDPGRDVRFSTWLYALVRNHCYDQLRRKQLPVYSMNSPAWADDEQEEWLAGGEPPEGIVFRREFGVALMRAIANLPSDLRHIFHLREFDGFEFRKIAKMLSIPLGTVKSQHYRAVDRLRYLLRSFRPAAQPV